MREFSGRVAVVTGGASGIGRALCDAFARRGMRIAIADVQDDALAHAETELRDRGSEVLAAVVDVRDAAAVAKFADDVHSRFGGAHVLCNNAGVARGGLVAELSLDDWRWVVEVNLMGVVNGIHAFLPRMRAAGEPCHVVNTASLAGLVAMPGMGPYTASKYAVVAISETLAAECAGTNVGVSVLCPSWVNTRIGESEGNAPPDLELGPLSQYAEAMTEGIRELLRTGLEPAEVAERTVAAIESGALYVLTHPEFMAQIEERFRAIMNSRP